MIWTRTFFLFGLLALLALPAQAQELEEMEILEGWNTNALIGIDLSQLLQINPKQGAGQNYFGLGGAVLGAATYKKNRILWESSLVYLLGVQRVGAGLISVPTVQAGNGDVKVPFQKTVDDLRIGSKIGYALDQSDKWYLTAGFTLFTNTLTTYPGPATLPGNFLENFADTLTNSSFFNPAYITLSLGLEYKPNEYWSIYYSPIGAKFVVVPDDEIASLGIHGNPVRGMRDPITGLYTDFDNVDYQFGSLLRAAYERKFWKDRFVVNTNILLYSNYLRNPQNIDVDWTTVLGLTIVKGLELSLIFNVFYDDDVRVQITDYDAVGGVNGLGKRVNFTQQLLVSYRLNFGNRAKKDE